VSSQQDYLQRLADLEAAAADALPPPAVLLERVAGLIAGRVGCGIDEAHAHLRLLAGEQGREPAAVAADVLAVMQAPRPAGAGEIRAAVQDALRSSPPETTRRTVAPKRDRARRMSDGDSWAIAMQEVLGAVAGNHTVVRPLRDATAQITDFAVVAVSPSVVDFSGRRATELVGQLISEVYPAVVGGPVWQAWADVLDDGQTREVGPIPYAGGAAEPVTIVVRVHSVGSGVLSSWVRPDEQARLEERIAQTERLGNLGWGEWDLLSGNVIWSDELYHIYERERADGPLSEDESRALRLPEDEPIVRDAAARFGRGDTVDMIYRVRVGDGVKHLRTVVDAIRDASGRPIKVYGIVQDVTVRETTRAKLAHIEQQLRVQQTTLAAEHRLAAQLQKIILPIPDTSIALPGLQAAVRYLPAEQANRVGGDWFHTSVTDDGDVLLAVGDVAGHGIRAATTMARLRHALAALSVTSTTDPAELLAYLNRLLRVDDKAAGTATAVIARFHPPSGTLVWAQAGHPPPLRTRDGHTIELDRPGGPLLGAVRKPVYGTATTELLDADLLLLYTDGLIENRRQTAAEGIAPVIRTLNAITREPLTDVVGRLQRANPEDDTCVLAVRVATPERPGR